MTPLCPTGNNDPRAPVRKPDTSTKTQQMETAMSEMMSENAAAQASAFAEAQNRALGQGQLYAPQQPSKAEQRRMEAEYRRRQEKARATFEAEFDAWRAKYDREGLRMLEAVQAFTMWRDGWRRW